MRMAQMEQTALDFVLLEASLLASVSTTQVQGEALRIILDMCFSADVALQVRRMWPRIITRVGLPHLRWYATDRMWLTEAHFLSSDPELSGS